MTRWIAQYTLDHGRIVAVRLGVDDGPPRTIHEWLVGVTVDAEGNVRGEVVQDLGASPELSSRQIRLVKPAEALRRARQTLGGTGPVADLLRIAWQRPEAPSREWIVANTAARYVAALDAGERAPVARVAADLGLRQSQVRDRIYRARQLGFLGGSPDEKAQGRARGPLSPAAIAVLGKGGPS